VKEKFETIKKKYLIKGRAVSSNMKKNLICVFLFLLIAGVVISGCSNSNAKITRLTDGASISQSSGMYVKIIYDEPWFGTITIDGSKTTFEGDEPTAFEITGNPSSVGACVIKKGPSKEKTTIQIIKNGQILEEDSTMTPGGVVCI